jgi:hypothetical protein
MKNVFIWNIILHNIFSIISYLFISKFSYK